MDHYSYDRTASEKVWHDMMADAQAEFMGKVIKDLAKELGGESKPGAFGSGGVYYGEKAIRLGFKGGSIGTVYVVLQGSGKEKKSEHSVVNHTPSSFATFLVNSLKLKA